MMRAILIGLPIVLSGLLAGLLIFAPANKVVGLLQPRIPPQWTLAGVEGGIWQGDISRIQGPGITISPLLWKLYPLPLLAARLSADVQATLSTGDRVRSHMIARRDGTLELRELRLQMGIADIARLARQPFVPVDGMAQLSLDLLQLNHAGRPRRAEGRLDVVELKWTLLKPHLPLGSFAIEISTDEAGIIEARIQDQDAALRASGRLRLLPDGTYEIDVLLRPTESTPPLIRNGLAGVGQPRPDGSFAVLQKGAIPGW